MSFSAARPLAPWRWLGIPALLCVAGAVVLSAPINIYGLRLPEPVLPLVPAFAWAVIRPSVMAPFVLVLLGLFLDVYWGGTMGLWPLALLVAYALPLFGRSIIIGQGRLMNFVWYACACLAAQGCAVLIMLIVHGTAPGFVPLFWQFLATIVLYPLAERLIERFEDADVRFR